jgi:N4-(beta-N-acetylglucosaminyl)-L-asparaginase
MNKINRRDFLAASGAVAAAGVVVPGSAGAGWSARGVVAPGPGGQPGARDHPDRPGDAHRGQCVISSGNGQPAVELAMKLIQGGADPVDAIVKGVALVENDPNDMSVGYGGLPNEDGVVQLDASVMHGPTHKAGAVGALEGIKNPAAVALDVLKRTDHVLIVGEGALRFARAMGYPEENLLTEEARKAWLKWKENLGKEDDRLNWDERDWDLDGEKHGMIDGVPYTTGTIHCSAVDAKGDLAGCTTTSGLSWKIPGRLGDSPIIGAGNYTDNDVGSAGATGRGEAVMVNCGAFLIVQHMERGLSPTDACLAVLKRIADKTKEKRLLDARGRPNYGVTLYALRKDGAYGSASMYPGAKFAVHDGRESRLVACEWLFEREG